MGRTKKKPKCPRSAYIYFVKDYQRHLKKTKGPLSFGESSRLCAAQWKRLPQQVKDKYRKMSEKDAFRYRKEMRGLSQRELRMLRRKKRDPEAPIRPMTAYLWFCKSRWKKVAQDHPELSYTQVLKLLAQQWAKCGSRRRKQYEEMAKCDRKCYLLEKEKYRAQRSGRAKI